MNFVISVCSLFIAGSLRLLVLVPSMSGWALAVAFLGAAILRKHMTTFLFGHPR